MFFRSSGTSLNRVTPATLRFFPRRVSVFAGICGMILAGTITATAQTPSATAGQFRSTFAQVPLSFEANQGQTDSSVNFLSRGPGYALYLTPGEAVLRLQKSTGRSAKAEAGPNATLRMTLVGAEAKAAASGERRLPGTVNYFIGNDPSKWHSEIPTYARVSYAAVYPGVDLVYYGNQRELEYDFILAPGASAARIGLKFEGARPRLDKTGDMVLSTVGGDVRLHKPIVYQMDGDRKMPVAGGYTIAANTVHFTLGIYDRSKPLVIDPVLSYLTYLGGSSNDLITGIAVDSSGSAYTMATSNSLDYPLKNPYQATNVGGVADSRNSAIAVTKFNANGTGLIYSTFLNGRFSSSGNGIAVDPSGNAYIVGYSNSNDYPVTQGAFQTVSQGTNGVLTKLNPTGSALVYSTFLGGAYFNQIAAVAVNPAGEAYVTGSTYSACYATVGAGYSANCFPTTSSSGPINSTAAGFFTKFDAAGVNLLYSAVLVPTVRGSTLPDSVAVDPAGNGYIAGITTDDLFTTPGSYEPSIDTPGTLSTGFPFAAKYDLTINQLAYSTFVNGTPPHFGSDVAYVSADAAGNAYLAGSTSDCSFPTTAGAFQTQAHFPPGTQADCHAGFVAKLNPAGSTLLWSTFLGNTPQNGEGAYLNAITVGPDSSVYVAGRVNGGGFPLVNPIQNQTDYNAKAVVSRLSPDGSSLLFSTTLGGTTTGSEYATGIALDAAGDIYVAGQTNSYSLPVTPGAFQAANKTPNGSVTTGFVAKIAASSGSNGISSLTALTISPATTSTGQPVTFTATVTAIGGPPPVPTGNVTFSSGNTNFGTGVVDASGRVTLTISTIMPGTYVVTASYTGDSAYSASVSPGQTLTVSGVPTSTVLTIAPSSLLAGQSVTLSAKVTPASGTAIPTGTITFQASNLANQVATLDASGKATLTTSSIPADSYTFAALYSGDSSFATSASAASSLTVNSNSQTIAFTGLPTTATFGSAGPYTLTATASSGLPVGYSVSGPATLSGNTLTLTGAGTVSVTASQAGNGTYASAIPVTQTITVTNLQSQTITFTGLPATAVVGAAGPYTLNATASSGLPVAYSVSGPASLDGSTLFITGAGTLSVIASQAGNGTYAAAIPVTQTITITNLQNQFITFTGLPVLHMPFGSAGPYTLNATASSGLPVSYSVSGPATLSGNTLTVTGPGTITVTASQAGNASFKPADPVTQVLTITDPRQTITFTGLPATATFGSAGPYGLTASASSALPVSYSVSGPATLAGDILTITGVGTVSITASQAGNANYNAATPVTQVITIAKGDQIINFAGLPGTAIVGATFTLNATATSGLPVTFSVSGSATLAGATLTITGGGSIAVTASQTGGANYNAAVPVTQIISVPKANQTITFTGLPATTAVGATYTLNGTASSGLAVAYSLSGPATLSGATLNVTGTGTITVTASQPGNANYNAAFPVTQTLTAGDGSQTITFYNVAVPNLPFNYAGPYRLMASASSGLLVTFSVSGPATLSGNTLTITGAGTVLVTASQAGNSFFRPALPVTQVLNFSKASQTIAFTTNAPPYAVFGSAGPYTVSAAASSGLPVTLSVSGPATLSGNTLTITGPGTVQVSATQAGNADYFPITPYPLIISVRGAFVPPPVLVQLTTTAVLSKVSGGYNAVITVRNTGISTASAARLTVATLGAANLPNLPLSLGDISPNGSATVTVTFPAAAGASGTAVREDLTSDWLGGTFGGSFRVLLP